jgi:hypothetical protein
MAGRMRDELMTAAADGRTRQKRECGEEAGEFTQIKSARGSLIVQGLIANLHNEQEGEFIYSTRYLRCP